MRSLGFGAIFGYADDVSFDSVKRRMVHEERLAIAEPAESRFYRGSEQGGVIFERVDDM